MMKMFSSLFHLSNYVPILYRINMHVCVNMSKKIIPLKPLAGSLEADVYKVQQNRVQLQ